MISYSDVLIKKFCFTSLSLSKEFCDYIWSVQLPDTGRNDGEIRYKWPNVSEEIRSEILKGLKNLGVEEDLWKQIQNFSFDINCMQKGEWVPMHNEVAQKSPFEIIIWLTKTDDYQGREFVMEGPGFQEEFKPKNGDICLLDTTQHEVYHGVNKLESDTQIISIVGGLQEWEHYASR